MFSFKRLIALVGLVAIVVTLVTLMPHTGLGQGQAAFRPRQFYLTPATHNGSQALSACVAGYHMASVWEMFDTSNIRYNTELGFTQADSGSGPPSGSPDTFGWVRTGNVASTVTGPGQANCDAWKSADEHHFGTGANLPTNWLSDVPRTGPWAIGGPACNVSLRVWCVQD